MKFIISEVTALMHENTRKINSRLLLKFSALLIFFFAFYSVLFHLLMLYEGRQYSWITGLYWTLTVMSTLGFGDITFHSDIGMIFSIIVLLNGILLLLIILPFTFIQFFYAPWLEAQKQARTPRSVPETMSGHVIFTHFDDVAANTIERFVQYGIPYVVLVQDLLKALELLDLGYRAVLGDLDRPETYRKLRAERAAMVVVLNPDVAGTNIIFTIREISEKVMIVTNADLEDSVDILQLAGADHVFQFTGMLGSALARRVLGVSMKANVIGSFDELLIAEAPVMRTPLQGKTLAETELHRITGINVVGIWERGAFLAPNPMMRLGESTVLVMAGTEQQMDQYDRLIGSRGRETLTETPVVVLGGGRVGQAVGEDLKKRRIDYRIVEKNERVGAGNRRFVHGSAGDLDVLIRAGIKETQSIIITTHDDDLNIYLTIYCRRLRPDAQIISRASLDRNVNTLHRAGASLVMSFSSLCTTTLMNLLNPSKTVMLSEGLNVFRNTLAPDLAGKSIVDLQIREKSGCSVMALKRNGSVIINPAADLILEKKDELILIGTEESEKRFNELFAASG